MKPWIKILIGVIAGFGGGFASGFIFHKKLNDVEFEEISEEEMALIENSAREKENGGLAENSMKTDDDLPTNPNELRNRLQGKKSYLQADTEAKEAYASVWNTVRDYSNEENADALPVEVEEGFDPEFMQEINEEDSNDLGKGNPPYEIDLAAFYNMRNDYDKITIDWYEPKEGTDETDTFMDEKEEIIADISSYIGEIDIYKLFEKTAPDEDPDIRFVRNEAYQTDYEIVRHHRSWTETTGTGGSE